MNQTSSDYVYSVLFDIKGSVHSNHQLWYLAMWLVSVVFAQPLRFPLQPQYNTIHLMFGNSNNNALYSSKFSTSHPIKTRHVSSPGSALAFKFFKALLLVYTSLSGQGPKHISDFEQCQPLRSSCNCLLTISRVQTEHGEAASLNFNKRRHRIVFTSTQVLFLMQDF